MAVETRPVCYLHVHLPFRIAAREVEDRTVGAFYPHFRSASAQREAAVRREIVVAGGDLDDAVREREAVEGERLAACRRHRDGLRRAAEIQCPRDRHGVRSGGERIRRVASEIREPEPTLIEHKPSARALAGDCDCACAALGDFRRCAGSQSADERNVAAAAKSERRTAVPDCAAECLHVRRLVCHGTDVESISAYRELTGPRRETHSRKGDGRIIVGCSSSCGKRE